MHVNVPVALSFVCGAPFSKAAGGTSEDQIGMPEVFGWTGSYPPFNTPAGLKERMWQKTHVEGSDILKALYQYHCFL